MRIPGQRHRTPALQGEAMTPMIDVVFLLLVFFVCASIGQLPDFLLPAELGPGATAPEVDVSQADPEIPEHQTVRISLRPGDSPDNVSISLNALEIAGTGELRHRLSRLSEIDPLTQIILDIDDQVTNQLWIAVYDLCQRLGFESISFGVRE